MSMENVTQAKSAIEQTSAYKTLTAFFDNGEFVSVDTLAKSQDTYAEVVAGYGAVNEVPVYAFAQNSDFCGGAMSKAQVPLWAFTTAGADALMRATLCSRVTARCSTPLPRFRALCPRFQ